MKDILTEMDNWQEAVNAWKIKYEKANRRVKELESGLKVLVDFTSESHGWEYSWQYASDCLEGHTEDEE